ncbi:membrane protein insertase YidC [Pararhodobacter sp. SW119]|uniref:membrane protein insertase YidC n=1 Tax=Pararhodobacter sp. SW119 TaxID=2780075 RepID=UPI001AE0A219|nr:membrane protein insertase YidC [Pararhodobacter sp. SW119]
MDNQNKNLILAFALSLMVILIWFALFPPPEPEPAPTVQQTELVPPPASDEVPAEVTLAEEAEPTAARIDIDTPRLSGTISLTGGRVDDLQLRDYFETTRPGSDIVHLFNPVGGGREPFYALYGWSPRGALGFEQVPGPNTVWEQVGDNALSLETPVTIRWDNGEGLVFQRTYEIDADFMFTVTQSVENNTGAQVALDPYGILAQHGLPSDLENFFISHEGLVQMADGQLTEDSYKSMRGYNVHERERTPATVTEVVENGWIGLTGKYFMATLIGAPGQAFTAVAQYVPGADIYQTSIRQSTVTVPAGTSASSQSMLFAGAKEWSLIRSYEREANVDRFTDAIDWGWFFFLTKPIFALLHFINGIIGNMGWSILVLTLIIKAVLLPLAWKSYVSMAKMKDLQPEMMAIKERAGDDRQKLQQEMMKLYKEKKVNPAAGCLPILLQIPIFFSLYKVIFVTIELRHAPWLWVFNDLSAPDPTSIVNLFGLLPWAAPDPNSIAALILIGIMPLMFGFTMWLQMRLNPAPTDPMQATIFNWMPWVFMFVLGGFASGLLLYWIGNNIITFSQQYMIMRLNGSKPDLFGNIKQTVRRKKGDATK